MLVLLVTSKTDQVILINHNQRGLSETQGAGPLEAGKKCSAVGINKFCIIIKHQGIGILRLRLSDMDFLGFF